MYASNAGLLACLTRGMGYALHSRLSLDGAGSVYAYNLLHIVQLDYRFWSCEAPSGRWTPVCIFVVVVVVAVA